MKKEEYRLCAQFLRYWSIRATTEAGSGHPTSCLSAADLVAVLGVSFWRYNIKRPEDDGNDRIIFSKGHAAPLLYALFAAAGAFGTEELLTLRKKGTRLPGHPMPSFLPWVDVATGSLGQGLSAGVGMALAGKYIHRQQYRVFTLLGDSEMAEGSVWEAIASAAHYRLDNLIAIIDVNRLGQSQETMLAHDIEGYARRIGSFGWHTITIDGHAYDEIERAYAEALQVTGTPVVIIAKTYKGKGVSFLEDKEGRHGKPLSAEEAERAYAELNAPEEFSIDPSAPADRSPISHTRNLPDPEKVQPKAWKKGDTAATRQVYGETLALLGEQEQRIVALDAETKNSTFAEVFAKAHPGRFFEMFIAEQNMVGTALGLSVRGLIPFVSTFAAFFTRAYDQIRMSGLSEANVKIVGSHAGVSIGEDGASQMGLEDIAMMRAVYGSAVVYPADAVATAALVQEIANYHGVAYMRTTRAKTPVIYDEGEKFPLGKCKVVRKSNTDAACIMAAGITLHEALKAYQRLSEEGILVRVVDVYSIKPIDAVELHRHAQESGGKVIVVEDHAWDGGLGDAVLNVFAEAADTAVVKMAVHILPRAGTPEEMLQQAEIDAESIYRKVREIVSG